MKLTKVLLGTTLAVSTSVLAAQSVPVYDLNAANNTGASGSVSQQLQSLSLKLDARNRAQVNLQRQLDELQNEVDELRGATELHTHQLDKVLERQRELYQELDRRVSQALQTPAAVPVTSPQSTATANTNSVSYSNNLTENEAYDRAVNLVLKDKLYDQAIPEFRQFNQKYPNSSYSANAHYWLGQLLFNKGELVEAETEFATVVNQHKDSTKRSDALLKLAMVAEKQNKNTAAKSYYNQLIKEYPSSTAAKLAKPRVNKL